MTELIPVGWEQGYKLDRKFHVFKDRPYRRWQDTSRPAEPTFAKLTAMQHLSVTEYATINEYITAGGLIRTSNDGVGFYHQSLGDAYEIFSRKSTSDVGQLILAVDDAYKWSLGNQGDGSNTFYLYSRRLDNSAWDTRISLPLGDGAQTLTLSSLNIAMSGGSFSQIGNISMTGALTGVTDLHMSGALSTPTSLALSGPISGATTLNLSGLLTSTSTSGAIYNDSAAHAYLILDKASSSYEAYLDFWSGGAKKWSLVCDDVSDDFVIFRYTGAARSALLSLSLTTGGATFSGSLSSSSLSLTTPLPITSGGTGASSAVAARANLLAAALGANVDITSLTALTGQVQTPSSITCSGNITGATFNKVSIVAPASSAALTIANTKSFSVSNSLAFQGTDGTTFTFPSSSGTIAILSDNLGSFASTTSAQLAGVISDETGSGSLVFSNSPTLSSPKIDIIQAPTQDLQLFGQNQTDFGIGISCSAPLPVLLNSVGYNHLFVQSSIDNTHSFLEVVGNGSGHNGFLMAYGAFADPISSKFSKITITHTGTVGRIYTEAAGVGYTAGDLNLFGQNQTTYGIGVSKISTANYPLMTIIGATDLLVETANTNSASGFAVQPSGSGTTGTLAAYGKRRSAASYGYLKLSHDGSKAIIATDGTSEGAAGDIYIYPRKSTRAIILRDDGTYPTIALDGVSWMSIEPNVWFWGEIRPAYADGVQCLGTFTHYFKEVNAKDFYDRSGVFLADKETSYEMIKNLKAETGEGFCRKLEERGHARICFSELKKHAPYMIDEGLMVAEEDIVYDSKKTKIKSQVTYDKFKNGDVIAKKGELTRWKKTKLPDGTEELVQSAEGLELTAFVSHLTAAVMKCIEKIEAIEKQLAA